MLDQYMSAAIESISDYDLSEESFGYALREEVSLMAGLSSSDDFCLD